MEYLAGCSLSPTIWWGREREKKGEVEGEGKGGERNVGDRGEIH